MNNKRKILIIILIIFIISTLFLVIKNNTNKALDPSNNENIYYEVKPGSDPYTVAQELQEMDVIIDAQNLYDLFVDNDGQLYVNTYVLSPSMTPEEIFNILNSPTSNINSEDKLLIYEGETVDQVAESLALLVDENKNQILDYWSDETNLNKWISKYEILTEDILSDQIIYPLEGYLYPATYDVLPEDNLESITLKILDQTNASYVGYLGKEGPENYSFHQMLTLASIVERETIFPKDKPKVAGVFLNRIRIDQKLESDITVLYALGEHKETVTYDDLEVDSPYNTYANLGLTPGPISSVSLETLDSTYNYEENDYYFFFAKQDTGEVIYTKTYEEHLQVSEKYAWE